MRALYCYTVLLHSKGWLSLKTGNEVIIIWEIHPLVLWWLSRREEGLSKSR